MVWFDNFALIIIFCIFLILFISLILFIVSYIKSIMFVMFLQCLERKGYKLKFVEYLNDDILK